MDSRMHVVVAGAGVAGLETALALRALAAEHVSVELVAPEEDFVYRPLTVAEPFRYGEARRFPLERLVRAAGADLRRGSLVAVDADSRRAWLAGGESVDYGALVLALGARAREAVPGALTFRGAEDRAALEALLARATAGTVRRLVFALPAGSAWPLPLYELAFLTHEYLVDSLTRGVEIAIATPEERPLGLFGDAASEAVAELLELRGIRVEREATPVSWEAGTLRLADGRALPADAVVALPRLVGPSLEGVPQDEDGFVAADELGWVYGLTDVYAAGDLTRSPVKQGGIAAQQADAVASAIAADAGAAVRPTPSRPVLRGLLLTGLVPRFLRHEGGSDGPSLVDTQPLWWPPAKIVGRHLSPFLAEQLGLAAAPPAAGVAVEIAVDRSARTGWSTV